MKRDYLRGHPIELKNGEWFYKDNETPTVGNERSCGSCGKGNTKEGHDGCLGTIRGLMNACCGHGHKNEAYVQFLDGRILSGEDALTVLHILKLDQVKEKP